MNEIAQSIMSYLSDVPNATFRQIQAALQTPPVLLHLALDRLCTAGQLERHISDDPMNTGHTYSLTNEKWRVVFDQTWKDFSHFQVKENGVLECYDHGKLSVIFAPGAWLRVVKVDSTPR